jgi:hypothetical protein
MVIKTLYKKLQTVFDHRVQKFGLFRNVAQPGDTNLKYDSAVPYVHFCTVRSWGGLNASTAHTSPPPQGKRATQGKCGTPKYCVP